MSSMFNKVKSAISSNKYVDEGDKQKIISIVTKEMEDYKKKYYEEFEKLSKEKAEKDEEIIFEDVDEAAKKNAGIDTATENISDIVREDIMPSILVHIPKENQQVAETTSTKIINEIVRRTVGKIVLKMTDEQKSKVDTGSDLDTSDEIPVSASIEMVEPEKFKMLQFQSTVGPQQELIKIEIDISKTIGVIKKIVGDKYNLPSEEFHLSHSGRTLDVDEKMKNYKISSGDSILLIPVSTAG